MTEPDVQKMIADIFKAMRQLPKWEEMTIIVKIDTSGEAQVRSSGTHKAMKAIYGKMVQ